VARAIHYTSLRADKPFIPIDCTTIPAELMESELFGYEKGAFTCADERKLGLIEMAQGGTTFFDEIGDLDFALQKKLLRFLQEKEIRRISGQKKIKVDVRVLSATNRDIEASLEAEEFRPDLFYRLNVISIRIPPLRDRMDDIPLLANHYLAHFREKNRKEIREVDPEVLMALKNYDWPGNVRELENVMERAVILCQSDTINMEYLPKKMKMLEQAEYPEIRELNLPDIEKKTILKALDKSSWNQSKAARLLGISRKQLRTKMKNLDLLPPAE
jgi:two-component system response regulator HydG/two-component system response regulator AtoC